MKTRISDLEIESISSGRISENNSVFVTSRSISLLDEKFVYSTVPLRPSAPSPPLEIDDVLRVMKIMNDENRTHMETKRESLKQNNSFVSKLFFDTKKSDNDAKTEKTDDDDFTLPSISTHSNLFFKNWGTDDGTFERTKTKFGSNIRKNSLKKKNRRKPGALRRIFKQIHDVTFPGSKIKTSVDGNDPVRSVSSVSLHSIKTETPEKSKPKVIKPVRPPKLSQIEPSELDNLSILSLKVESGNAISLRARLISDPNGVGVPTKPEAKVTNSKMKKNESPITKVISEDDLESWMSNLPSELQEIPLYQLLIPGSHDSFSYSLEDGQVGPDSPSVLSHLAACSPCIAWPAIMRWAVTQRASVEEQLKHGVRYFDVRVAVRNERFYFVHGVFGADLEFLLEEIRIFLNDHEGEVVLLDIQHLHGLTREDHVSFVSLLKKIFNGIICPFFGEAFSELSLSFLTRRKYLVLIFYRDPEIQEEFGFWPGALLPNPWPQATRVATLMPFLQNQLDKKSDETFFVAQCVLTPSGGYLARNLPGSLENKMAQPCNKATLEWILSLPVCNTEPNVIMCDFVASNDWAIPKAIIQHNTKRESPQNKSQTMKKV